MLKNAKGKRDEATANKEALQKAFRTELKKPIQKMMGRTVDYENFLKQTLLVALL